MHIPLAVVPHDGAAELAVLCVALDLDAEGAVDLEAQEDLVVDGVAAALLVVGGAVEALDLELLQAGVEVGGLLGEALGLHLGVGGGLCGAEFCGVEAGDLGGVGGGGVRLRELGVLGGHCV